MQKSSQKASLIVFLVLVATSYMAHAMAIQDRDVKSFLEYLLSKRQSCAVNGASCTASSQCCSAACCAGTCALISDCTCSNSWGCSATNGGCTAPCNMNSSFVMSLSMI